MRDGDVIKKGRRIFISGGMLREGYSFLEGYWRISISGGITQEDIHFRRRIFVAGGILEEGWRDDDKIKINKNSKLSHNQWRGWKYHYCIIPVAACKKGNK